MAGFSGTRLGKFVNAMANAKVIDIEKEAYNDSVLDQMSDLNREQFNLHGLYPNGIDTPEYSPYTIELKAAKGQRYDHMTFRDTGQTQDSIEYFFNGALTANI